MYKKYKCLPLQFNCKILSMKYRIEAFNKSTWGVLCCGLFMALTIVGCGPIDDDWDDETNVGSVQPENVVVGNERWRGFLNTVAGYSFVLNNSGLVDTIYYDYGYATFVYRDEYRDPDGAALDLVEMKLYDSNNIVRNVCTFNIGRNGYAKNATEIDRNNGESYTWKFEYDKYGHLTSLDAGGDLCTFEYMDGNLIEYTNYVDADETFYFSYSSLSSQGYMPYFHSPGYVEEDFGPILPMAYLAGLAGRPSKNLPLLCEREQDFNEYYWVYEYKYVFNDDGMLVGLYFQQKP